MKKISMLTLLYLLFVATGAHAEMDHMQDMKKHMKDHMGGEMNSMEGNTKSKKSQKGYAQEAEAAGVTAKVIFKNPKMKAAPVFFVSFDTHSVDLDKYRFEDIVVLRDDAGKEYRPQITSSSGTGHHREAVLEFKGADLSASKTAEISIKGVAGVEDRVFKFDMEKGMMEKKSL